MTTDAFDSYLENSSQRTLLRFSTAGSVDDGKSTLIGRLLLDTKSLFEDAIAAVEKVTKPGQELDLSYFTDGLLSEREQKITIDVAYRFFSSAKRNFILADTPGHEQYTRNMVTGASTSEAAIMLVDASRGVTDQTRRHAFILSLLGIKHILVAVNKMDLVDYSESEFKMKCDDFREMAGRMGIGDLRFVPVSALNGDNIVNASKNMPWFQGETILRFLENVYVDGSRNLIDFRFPVQRVSVSESHGRSLQGQISSGVIRPGDEVVVLPSGQSAVIKEIFCENGPLEKAFAPQSVSLVLDREVDADRGDMIAPKNNLPHLVQDIESMLVWMGEEPLEEDKTYLLKQTTNTVKATVTNFRYKVNINSFHKDKADAFHMNEIGRLAIHTHQPIAIDYYKKNRATGGFVLIDPISHQTVAAGMIVDRITAESSKRPRSTKVGHTFWLTGLSGAGKSTLSQELVQRLQKEGLPVVSLDGDDVRTGLCKDLGFSEEDRQENIRRVAEVARLFNKNGTHVVASFISPTEKIRGEAQQIIGKDRFQEIFVSADLKVCEGRDVKGLYKKARSGAIKEFTGVTAPYEQPQCPSLKIQTDQQDLSECSQKLYNFAKDVIAKSTKD